MVLHYNHLLVNSGIRNEFLVKKYPQVMCHAYTLFHFRPAGGCGQAGWCGWAGGCGRVSGCGGQRQAECVCRLPSKSEYNVYVWGAVFKYLVGVGGMRDIRVNLQLNVWQKLWQKLW